MDLQEVKKFMEQNKDSEEVKSYIRGFITPDRVNEFLETEDGKKLVQPKIDANFTKGLETWKKNNLEKLLDEEIKKRFPEKNEKEVELEKIKSELQKMQNEKLKETLTNKALKIANEKKLPVDLVDFFISDSEENTIQNLETLENTFSKHVETLVEERLKSNTYTPPKGGDDKNNIKTDDFLSVIRDNQARK